MTFRDDMSEKGDGVLAALHDVFVMSGNEVQRSITGDGVAPHGLTGAPGQPVGQYRRYEDSSRPSPPVKSSRYAGGDLRGSWTPELVQPWVWRFTTNLAYAEYIEEGISIFSSPVRDLVLRSTVGGFHSVKLTRAGWPLIVDFVAAQNQLSGVRATSSEGLDA